METLVVIPPEASKRMDLHVEIVTGEKDFLDLEPVWNSLLSRSGSDNLFLTFEWLSAWWRHFGRQHQLFIAVVRNGSAVTGILPLMATRREGFRQLGMIANKISDYKDFIIDASEDREAVIRKILDALADAGDWDFLMLNGFPEESVNSSALSAAVSGRHSVKMARAGTASAPYIPLEGNWESYFDGLKKSFREDTLRLQRKLEKKTRSHSFSDEIDPEKIGEAIDEIITLNAMKYSDNRRQACVFANCATRSFYKDFAMQAFRSGWLRLPTLYIDGEIAARFLDFQYKDKYYGIITGYNAKFSCYSPGRLIDMRQIKYAYEQGLMEYDLLCGHEAYKFNYNAKVRDLHTIFLFRNNWRGRLARHWIAGLRPAIERLAETRLRNIYWWYREKALNRG